MRSFARDNRFANDGTQPSSAPRDNDAATERVGKVTQVDVLYRRAADASEVDREDPSVRRALDRAGRGKVLPADVRANLELLLGQSLEGVRIHSDAEANAAAQALRAEAFTSGQDIFFADGKYAPSTHEGRKLLAHEAAHAVQAAQGRTARGAGIQVSDRGEALEREAEAAAERVHLASARTIQALAGQATAGQPTDWDPERAQARLERVVADLARTIDTIAPKLADIRPTPQEPTVANLDPRAGTRTIDKDNTVEIARTRLEPERQTTYRMEGSVENDSDKAARAEIKRINEALPAAERALKEAQKLASDAAKQAKKTTPSPAAIAEVEKAVADAKAAVTKLVAELRANQAVIHDNSARQRQELVSGDPNASEFWCSGLTIWTLGGKGYNLEAPLLGSEDRKPFRFQAGKRTSTITLKALIDGEPESVEAAIYIQRNGLTQGDAQVIPLAGEPVKGGHRLGYDAAGHATSDAVKGAAGAFAMFGIGTEVPPDERKPGDFAQRRDVSSANVTHELKALEKELAAQGSDVSAAAVARDIATLESELGAPDLDEKTQQAKTDRLTRLRRLAWLREEAATEIHRGKGHAWQVTEVQVTGDALFGTPQSPRLVRGTAPAEPTWLTNKQFVITPDTNPALVGKHEIEKDRIIEANVPNAKTGFAGGVREPETFVEKRVSDPTSVVFYGRLETSAWVDWQPADEASARAAASARE